MLFIKGVKIDAVIFEKRRPRDFKIVQIVSVPDYLHGVEIKKRHPYFYFKTFLFFIHCLIPKKSEYLIAVQIFSMSLSIALSSTTGALTALMFFMRLARSGLASILFLMSQA